MDHWLERRQRLWEAMESCRHDTDDLSDPQFAELAAQLADDAELRGQFQRLQEADGAIRAVFASVPVPAGLADRVLQRLTEAVPTAASGPLPATDSPAAPPGVAVATTADSPAPLPVRQERFSRRRLLVGFTAIATAAALLAAVWIETHLPRNDTPTSVLNQAMDFFDKDSNHTLGEFVSPVAPPAEYPLSRDIVPLRGVRWRRVGNFLGDAAVAYDLPTIAGRATLYVVARNVPGLPAVPPPCLSTGGKSVGAWQTRDTLYVLVVEGDAGMYSSYLDRSNGPLT